MSRPSLWSAARFPHARAEESDQANDESMVDVSQDEARSIHQQDYDRLLFSTPVRRLADKTQVWPMDANDGVRSRLTHSHEVANLAKSIGTRVAMAPEGSPFGAADLHGVIQPILSSIGLAHDLGNPPFGHQGEVAIGQWFERRKDWIFDRSAKKGDKIAFPVAESLRTEFLDFDGNPQTLRILTRLQTSHRSVGLDLTAGTLAGVLKYPVHAECRDKDRACVKKAGYFESERDIINWVRGETGLQEGQRHPLTWIMEACDDIAYSVLDVDDLLKKAIISPDDVLVILKHTDLVSGLPCVVKLEKKFNEINMSDRRAEIRRDIKEQYVRSYLIEALINDASKTYIAKADAINNFTHDVPLMEKNPLCDALKHIAQKYGFAHTEVLRAEAVGDAAIDGLMTAFWTAIQNRKKPHDLMSTRLDARDRYVFSLISPNYLEAACHEAKAQAKADNEAVGRYHELRLLTDMISGMTDGFAINTWQKLKELPNVGRP